MFGSATDPKPADDADTAVGNSVTRGTGAAGYSLFPNRGIVAAPWIDAKLAEAKAAGGDLAAPDNTVLKQQIATTGSWLRTNLAGPVLTQLVAQLTHAESTGEDVYAALYELTDPELTTALSHLGPRAHVVLGNGSFNKKNPDPNAEAAATLTAAQVDLHRRMVPKNHFAHNKFVVFAPSDRPERVWTGSTNWSPSGLCTQANHAVLVEDSTLASDYRAYWQRLLDSESGYPAALIDGDTAATRAGGPSTRAWFAPVRGYVDLKDAGALIARAEQGVLFLLFRPGNTDTLVDQIKAAHENGRFIRGIVNNDFLGSNTPPTLEFFNASAAGQHADPELILPDHLRTPTAGEDTEVGVQGVLIHSKVIVVDPFGDHPVVMTGSHNLGRKASSKNDDNLLIIENQRALARESHGLDAYDALTAARAADPGDGVAASLLGALLYSVGRRSEAVAAWEAAIDAGLEDPVLLRNLGLSAYTVLGDDDLAWRHYEAARRLAPENSRLLFEQDQLAGLMGHGAADRLARLEAAVALVAERDDLTIEHARLLTAVGRAAEALAVFDGRVFQPWEGGEGRVLGAWDEARDALGLPRIEPPSSLGEARPVVLPPAAVRDDGSTDYFATSLPELLLFTREVED